MPDTRVRLSLGDHQHPVRVVDRQNDTIRLRLWLDLEKRMPAFSLLPSAIPSESVTACIGLISDTHMPQRCAVLPAALAEVFAGVDFILHAGDLGELWVLDRLSQIAPLIAVHGNDETADAQRELPAQQLITICNQRILLYHSHHSDRATELALRVDDDWPPKLERR